MAVIKNFAFYKSENDGIKINLVIGIIWCKPFVNQYYWK